MMCLEDTWFVAAFRSTPMHDPGLKEVQRPARVCVHVGSKGKRSKTEAMYCQAHTATYGDSDTSDEGRVKMPYDLICPDTHQKKLANQNLFGVFLSRL